MARTTIKDFYGKILGSIEELPNKDRVARDFFGKILGRYDKKMNVTKDFFGKIIGTGDLTSALIFQANAEREAQLKSINK